MWASKAFGVQKAYWNNSANVDEERSGHLTSVLSQELQQIRNYVDGRLNCVHGPVNKYLTALKSGKVDRSQQEVFYQEIKSISLFSTGQMVDFCAMIFGYSVQILADLPPCAFCVVALGSLARGEMTPYSDLEYIILVERKTEKIAKFFEIFAMTSYFLIGNLRETTLNTMDIAELQNWFDDRQKNGFKIDGPAEWAGNIPTGKGSSAENTYIMTPAELLTTYKELLYKPKHESSRKTDLTSMLQYTKLIFTYGGGTAENLLAEFLIEKNKISPNADRRKMSIAMFEDDALRHNFRPDSGLNDKGYLIEAKRELHKYPSILIYNISIVLEFCELNSWDTLIGLHREGLISDSIHESLSFLLACSCYVRLATYLFHDSHDDRLCVLPAISGMKREDSLNYSSSLQAAKRWFMPQYLFVQHCEKSVPLKNHIAKCNKLAVGNLLQMEIELPTWLVQFQILYCCNNWVDAWDVFKTHVGFRVLQDNPEQIMFRMLKNVNQDLNHLWFFMEALGYALFQERHYQVACLCFQAFISIAKNLTEPVEESHCQLIIAKALDELGEGHIFLYLHEQAESEFKQALEIRAQYLDKNHALIGKTKMHLGRCIRLMMRYDEAERYMIEALQIFQQHASNDTIYDYYGDALPLRIPSYNLESSKNPDMVLQYLNNSSVSLARVLWHLAYLYFDLKYYQRALDYFKVSERMNKEVYGDRAGHKEISGSQFALAVCSAKMQQHENADRHLRNTMLIIAQVYKPRFVSLLKKADQRFGKSQWYYWFVAKKMRHTVI